MTQQGIFELLLQNDTFSNHNKFFNPTIIPEAADCVSEKLAGILCDSFKVKTTSSSYKRTNILTLLQNLSSNYNEHHNVDENNYSCVLKHLEKNYKKNNDVEEFLNKCDQDVKSSKLKLHEKIINTQRARSIRQKEIKMHRDFRFNRLRERLNNLGIVYNIPHSSSLYEPNEKIVKKIFGIEEQTEEKGKYKVELPNEKNSWEYRLRQIKFGYAVNNIGTEEEIRKHLENILDNLNKYEELYEFEKLFLKYIFKSIGKFPYLQKYFCDEFFFILEVEMIEIATQIIDLWNENDVQDFLKDLIEKDEFIHLKNTYFTSSDIFRKIKNVLYTLYCYSFCNSNLLKLINLLDEL